MKPASHDVEIVRNACRRVRDAAKKRGDIIGRCTEVSLTAALSAVGTSLPVLLCHGSVTVPGGAIHSHTWLRIGGVILDATLDQFTGCDVHVCDEADTLVAKYEESFYFAIRLPIVTTYLRALEVDDETN